MRLLINAMVLLMLAGVLIGATVLYKQDAAALEAMRQTQDSLNRLNVVIRKQSALAVVEGRRFPETIDPTWFEAQSAPINALLEPGHAWVEIAPLEERDLLHPRTKATTDKSIAQFWYNPELGVIRARVPMDVSDATTLALYNDVNGSHLLSLFELARPRIAEDV